MEQEQIFCVVANDESGSELVNKWFTYFEDAEGYFDEHVEAFKSDHSGRYSRLQLVDGNSTYKNFEINNPEESIEDDEEY